MVITKEKQEMLDKTAEAVSKICDLDEDDVLTDGEHYNQKIYM